MSDAILSQQKMLSGSTLKEVDTAQIKSDVGAPGACNDSCCNLSGLEESCWIHWARAVAGS
jgi:hypothetical protein